MIRPANDWDIPAIMDLLTQVLAVHNQGRPDIFKEEGYKYTPEELKGILRDEKAPVFVYTEECPGGEKVLGHCFCQIIERPERPSTYAYTTLYIDDLCVDEAARGKGVGRALYDYAKQYAKDKGFFNVTLHAWECNPAAVGFYRSLGMEVQSYTFEEVLK